MRGEAADSCELEAEFRFSCPPVWMEKIMFDLVAFKYTLELKISRSKSKVLFTSFATCMSDCLMLDFAVPESHKHFKDDVSSLIWSKRWREEAARSMLSCSNAERLDHIVS